MWTANTRGPKVATVFYSDETPQNKMFNNNIIQTSYYVRLGWPVGGYAIANGRTHHAQAPPLRTAAAAAAAAHRK